MEFVILDWPPRRAAMTIGRFRIISTRFKGEKVDRIYSARAAYPRPNGRYALDAAGQCFQDPAIKTTRFFGPCAPMTIVCSMSAVRDGPLIRLTVRGMGAPS